MRSTRVLLASLVLSSALGGVARGEPRVVVITLDGMRPEFYQSDQWEAPTLHRLAREGAWAKAMLPAFPSLTYVNHTTLITGVRPSRHGIVGNEVFDWQRGQLPGWAWEAGRIHVPTLFDLARQAHMLTSAFCWPVTVGAPVDFLVPEVFHVPGANAETTEKLIEQSSSADVAADCLKAGGPVPFSPTAPLDKSDAWMTRGFILTWAHRHPRLGLIHLVNIDWISHHIGPNTPEAHAALKEIDRDIGQIVASVDRTDTTVMVMGDHGFLEYKTRVAPNRLFLDRGWIRLKEGTSEVESWKVIADCQGACAAIYCKDPALEPEVLKLLSNQTGCTLVDHEALRRLGSLPLALCALSAKVGYAFHGSARAEFLEELPHPLGQHGYLPEMVPTGFLAWGAGAAPGRALGTFENLAVAPTICKLLSLPTDGMDGKSLELSSP